jgi:hypothetical protein
MSAKKPWQLRMFNRSLKKKMRYGVLKKHLGLIGSGEKCLLVTCGDNNGAMNHYLRELGGQWFGTIGRRSPVPSGRQPWLC